MRRLVSLPLWALTVATAVAGVYTADFSEGKIPLGVRVANHGALPIQSYYAHGFTIYGWGVERYGNRYVVMSPTHTGTDAPANTVISFPDQTIEPGAVAVWTACSALADFPEDYVLEVVTSTGTDVLAEVTGEEHEWTTRAVSLARYIGQTVTLRIRCTSMNRYMLLLRDFNIGTPDDESFVSTNLSPRYAAASEGARVCVEILSTGASSDCDAVVCLVAGERVASVGLDSPIPPASRLEAELMLYPESGSLTDYEVWLAKGDELRHKVTTGSVYTSDFVRRHLVDKATGMWCNNCTGGVLTMEELNRDYGESIIPVETHTTDALANQYYFPQLQFYAVPYFKLDRIKSTEGEGSGRFSDALNRPTTFGIEIASAERTPDGGVYVTARVHSSLTRDNADGRYRIGYVLTADFYDQSEEGGYYQKNSKTQPSAFQYYFLPATIPADVVRFHNVSLSSEGAFEGLEGSLPAAIEAGKPSEYTWSVERPRLMPNLESAKVVAYVLDTQTGTIENATSAPLPAPLTGVEEISADTAGPALRHLGGGEVEVIADGDCRLDVYDTAGRLLRSETFTAAGRTRLTLPANAGLRLLRLTTPTATTTLKTIL